MADTIRLYDDSDMKIAGVDKPAPVLLEDDVRKTLDEMKSIREKGLLLQAQQVGGHMADTVAQTPADQQPEIPLNQLLWLGVFAVTVGCESCVHNATAARAVLNAFHDRFRTLCPDAYDDSGYSISMSFYYWAVRSVGDSRTEIGRTFAMLCGNEKDPGLQAMGIQMFDRYIARMEALCAPLNQEV